MLRLSFNDALGDTGAQLVAACPALSGLLSLKMSFCNVGDAGVRALAAPPYLTNLRVLKLWNDGPNGIGDAGAKALADSPNVRRLVALRLTANAIGDAGAVALAESPHLGDLMYLSIRNNAYGPIGAEALARRFGPCLQTFSDDPFTVGIWKGVREQPVPPRERPWGGSRADMGVSRSVGLVKYTAVHDPVKPLRPPGVSSPTGAHTGASEQVTRFFGHNWLTARRLWRSSLLRAGFRGLMLLCTDRTPRSLPCRY
jgi:hypothetical protein